jgi:hypothetical protein
VLERGTAFVNDVAMWSRSLAALVVIGGTAFAGNPTRTHVVVIPARPIDVVPNVIYMNRCAGGCTIKKGGDDEARTDTSTIPVGNGPFPVTEFQWGDAEWNELVTCMKEVYSPFAVTVTDVRPADTVDYNEAIIAGTPAELGLPNTFGGIAPVMANCNPVDHAISFSFANLFTEPFERVHELCWVAAQEVGHTYGLDHEYQYFNGVSACNSPMTYRSDCGGQKFFRDLTASCGENGVRECACSHQQHSHQWLQTVMGAGTPITTTQVAVTAPAEGATIGDGETVHALASAQRGVEKVSLLLNGYRWLELSGVAVGPTGQPEADYALKLPADVPDGVIDIEVIASDDLDVTATAKVTVTKGAPCTSAAACAEGQLCENGRCFWTPPTGETGDSCEYPQFCVSGRCDTIDGESHCTVECNPTFNSDCPTGFDCLGEGTDGVCWPPASGGCCSAGDRTPWAPVGLAAMVFAFVLRRRR